MMRPACYDEKNGTKTSIEPGGKKLANRALHCADIVEKLAIQFFSSAFQIYEHLTESVECDGEFITCLRWGYDLHVFEQGIEIGIRQSGVDPVITASIALNKYLIDKIGVLRVKRGCTRYEGKLFLLVNRFKFCHFFLLFACLSIYIEYGLKGAARSSL